MSWFKLDDRFFDNPKIAALSDSAKVAYLEAGTYCARELTDGFIALNKAKAFAGKPRIVKELVPHLWEVCEGGFLVHDYLKYNPTREQVLAEREAARRRMGGLRSGRSSPEQVPEQEDAVRPSPVDPVNPVTPIIPNPIAPSPAPDPDDPDLLRVRRLRKEWETKVGVVPPIGENDFKYFARKVPEEWFMEAIDVTATEADHPSWKFCAAVLKRCFENQTPPRGQRKEAVLSVAGFMANRTNRRSR